ncbi:MAG: hypothetical protein KDK55_07085 [Chlamydiia bacterium]|nr:hypothetical protein [Chlamydiia bacterium]
MVKGKQKRVLKKGSLNNLVKPIGFVLCGLFIAFFWQYSQNRIISLHYLDQQGTAHSLTLPVKDRKRLAGLMQKLFAENSFAYTILGPKPVSWETYQSPLPLSNWTRFYDSFSEHNRSLRFGWKTWEKYQHLFPSAHLWAENPKCHPGLTSILIVNEDRFNDVVNKNKQDFQEVLHRKIPNGCQLIREAKNRSLMNEVLEGHQGLIGIVLGYGRDNSWKFLEGCKNRVAIGCVWEEEDDSIEESLELNVNLTDYYLSHYSCPSFAGDPNSAESLELKAEYTLTKQRIIEYYHDKDFLEATLSLLAGYHPIHE